jgi:hypothetical protein
LRPLGSINAPYDEALCASLVVMLDGPRRLAHDLESGHALDVRAVDRRAGEVMLLAFCGLALFGICLWVTVRF